ncbi:MAG TPA: H-type lectin domain-containing protein [Methanothrix sp.]
MGVMHMRLCILLTLIIAIMVPSAYGDLIQTGTAYGNNKNANWYLDEDWTGERSFLQHIDFQQPFTEEQPPIVLVMLNGLDSSKDRNDRVTLTSESVTNYGFNIRYSTWSDTKLYGVWVTWIALPQSTALFAPTKSVEVDQPSMQAMLPTSYYSFYPDLGTDKMFSYDAPASIPLSRY